MASPAGHAVGRVPPGRGEGERSALQGRVASSALQPSLAARRRGIVGRTARGRGRPCRAALPEDGPRATERTASREWRRPEAREQGRAAPTAPRVAATRWRRSTPGQAAVARLCRRRRRQRKCHKLLRMSQNARGCRRTLADVAERSRMSQNFYGLRRPRGGCRRTFAGCAVREADVAELLRVAPPARRMSQNFCGLRRPRGGCRRTFAGCAAREADVAELLRAAPPARRMSQNVLGMRMPVGRVGRADGRSPSLSTPSTMAVARLLRGGTAPTRRGGDQPEAGRGNRFVVTRRVIAHVPKARCPTPRTFPA